VDGRAKAFALIGNIELRNGLVIISEHIYSSVTVVVLVNLEVYVRNF